MYCISNKASGCLVGILSCTFRKTLDIELFKNPNVLCSLNLRNNWREINILIGLQAVHDEKLSTFEGLPTPVLSDILIYNMSWT